MICFTDRQTIIGSPKLSKFEGNADLSFQMSYGGVPLKQIEELIRLSESCSQEFQWDCYFAPLEIRGDKLLTWTDRSGKLIKCKNNQKSYKKILLEGTSQSYYYGNGTDTQSFCECATTNTCTQAFTVDFGCNCNSRVPVTMQDKGLVTNMNHLPILGFTYASEMNDYQKANLTLQPIKCQGNFIFNKCVFGTMFFMHYSLF